MNKYGIKQGPIYQLYCLLPIAYFFEWPHDIFVVMAMAEPELRQAANAEHPRRQQHAWQETPKQTIGNQ